MWTCQIFKSTFEIMMSTSQILYAHLSDNDVDDLADIYINPTCQIFMSTCQIILMLLYVSSKPDDVRLVHVKLGFHTPFR